MRFKGIRRGLVEEDGVWKEEEARVRCGDVWMD